MSKRHLPEIHGEQHIYRTHSSWYALNIITSLLMLPLLISGISNAFTYGIFSLEIIPLLNTLAICSLCLFVLLSLFQAYKIRQARLIIGPEGITCYAPANAIFSPWKHILRPASLPWGYRHMIALELDQRAQEGNLEQAIQEHRLGFEARKGFLPTLRGRDTIPVGYFLPARTSLSRWPETLLAQDIARYTPGCSQVQQQTMPSYHATSDFNG